MFKKLIILFITLASLELFNPVFIPAGFIKIFQLVGIGLMVMVLIIQQTWHKEIDFKKHHSLDIKLILLGLAVSMFMAWYGHKQAIMITIVAQRFMYFYLIYWVLHGIKASVEDIHSIIFWIGISFAVFYLLQYIAHPAVIFDVRIAEDRGTVRVFLAGFSFLTLAYFLKLNRLFRSFSVASLLSLILFFSILILMGTRQVIFSIMLITFLYILFSRVVTSRILIFIIAAASIVPILILFQDIFISLIDLSKTQSETFAENVRIRAAIFFLNDLFPNNIAYYTGNGADSANSDYGFMIQMYKDAYGFYQSDIGIIGDYTKFGVAFVLGVFFILFKGLFGKSGISVSYIKYFYLSILLTLFTGGGPFGQSDSIVAICFTLYLLDVDKHDRMVDRLLADNESENENDDSLEESYSANAHAHPLLEEKY